MIFVDASFWIALLVEGESHHDQAVRLYRAHDARRWFTSTMVIGETWNWLNRRAGHAAAVGFLDQLSMSEVQIIPHPTLVAEHQRITDYLRRRGEREYSYTDAASFQLMVGLGIGDALAFDSDFSANGFVELRA